jgi:aryl-alcohol dehydrogenase-like predicted oxidoreductase
VTTLSQRRIGDVNVGPVGLGAMQLSGDRRPPRVQAVDTIRAAVEAGVTLIDTADAYGRDETEIHHNEQLVAEALRRLGPVASDVLVATKGGHTRQGREWGVDGRPKQLKRACDASLVALGVEQIGLYQLHRPDPTVAFVDSLGALAELRAGGKVRLVGVSNVDSGQIRTALSVLGADGLASVQNEFSPSATSSWEQLGLCDELGLAFLAYSPLGGAGRVSQLPIGRPVLAQVAARHRVSMVQVILAWELSLSLCAIPIPGCSRPSTIRDCAVAADLQLDASELVHITRSCLGERGTPRVAD